MSEGPEVYRLSAQLTEELGGSHIVAIDSRLNKARAWLDEHPASLKGESFCVSTPWARI